MIDLRDLGLHCITYTEKVARSKMFENCAFQKSLTLYHTRMMSNSISFLCCVPYARPQFQSYGVETLHAASTQEGDGFRPCETSELIAGGLTSSRRLQLEERKSSVILAKAKLEILALLCPTGPTLG